MIRVLAMILLLASPAAAHEWYDYDCCSEKDCSPVADNVVVETAAGVLVRGYETIPEGDSRLRWSKDNRDHICIAGATGYYSSGVRQQLRCVYRKRKFM